ncbi:hypothetical protein [Cohnella sp. GCM10027633]|uniref:hypothetical protein n=1 Tax=unclassified Cohnella TaxID=2636738 RepID=UPI00363F2C88
MQETTKKRSYAAPVVFVIMVTLGILCILFYSKQLLAEQNEKTDRGMRLSEQYFFTETYAKLVREGATLMKDATTEIGRLQAKEKLGEARFASMEAVSLLGEALRIRTGQTAEELKPAVDGLRKALTSEDGALYAVGEHEGPLTDAEKAMLTEVAALAAEAEAALDVYLAPSGVAGYRIMAEGGEWIDAALEAKTSFDAIAEAMDKPNLNP